MRALRFRRSGLGFWVAAGALALVTAMFVAGVVQKAESNAARWGEMRRVLVARRAVAAGAVLKDRDVGWVDMPVALVPHGALRRSPVGRAALVALAPGEVLLASKVAPTGLRGVTALLRRGERALAVPVGPGMPPLGIGDRVDVLATAPESAATTVVAEGARVVGVDDRAVTIAVGPADASAVAAALAAATVTLALAAPA